jgi:hypothetical protein
MPRQDKQFRVLRSFDFTPRPNVVRAFRAGTIVSGLTAACIERGMSLQALEPLKNTRKLDT